MPESKKKFEEARQPERRDFTDYGCDVEIRLNEEGDVASIEGHAAVFGKESKGLPFTEIVDRGAFTNSVLEDDIVALFNHDSNFVLGRKSARTLKVEEDGSGLRFSVKPPDTQIGRDLPVLIKRGDVKGASFGFITIKDSWEEDGDRLVRHLQEVRLIDVSPATFPAYPSTTVAARSLNRFYEERGQAVDTEDETWKLDIARRRIELEEAS